MTSSSTPKMRDKRLDRSRSYGETHPAGAHGSFFSQDGYHFDNDGKLVLALLTEAQKEALSKPERSKNHPHPAAPGLTAEQYEALEKANLLTPAQKAAHAKTAEPEKPGAVDDGDDGTDDDEAKNGPNLELWLKGEAEYDFRDVQKTVKERHQKWCTRKDDLVQFLVADPTGPKVVPAEQVGPALKKYLD